MSDFFERVRQIDVSCGISVPIVLAPPTTGRLDQFTAILLEEVREVHDIYKLLKREGTEAEAIVALADWLGDIVVYCASEANRHGIPLEPVLQIILDSHTSKTVNGKFIQENGKVQKGPNYWKPEPKIALLLKAVEAQQSFDFQVGD